MEKSILAFRKKVSPTDNKVHREGGFISYYDDNERVFAQTREPNEYNSPNDAQLVRLK